MDEVKAVMYRQVAKLLQGSLLLVLMMLSQIASSADVLLSETDKYASITLSVDGLSASFNEYNFTGARSTIAIQPGSGFYYSEGRRLTASFNMGIGLATASEALDQYGGYSQQSIGVNTLGYVYYNGASILPYGNQAVVVNADTYGLAVDYRGANPIVYVIAQDQVLLTHTLDQVTTELFLYVYGRGDAGQQQMQINAGDHLGSNPFAYDVDAILTAHSVDTSELTLGWQKMIRLALSDESAQTIYLGESLTLNATATDPDNNDISSTISWQNISTSQTATGPSFSFTGASVGEHLIAVSVAGAEPQTYTVTVENIDTDGDGLSDIEENGLGTDPNNPDTDNDNLNDGEEVNTYETDPLDDDTDNDTMPDGWEVLYELDPLVNDASEDPDNDGLTNAEEFTEGTYPNNQDSDSDNLTDGSEVNTHGTDPMNWDSDSDVLNDGAEVNTHGTDPLSQDTDSDGIHDGYEVENGLSPTVDDAINDNDGDGVSNLDEFLAGTDANNDLSYPGADVFLYEYDKADSVAISEDRLSAAFSESNHRGVRSNIAIEPGSGFYYAEGHRLTDPANMGFGLATALETLENYGGITTQSMGVNTLGYVYYNATSLLSGGSSIWNADTYGLAVDYRGINPIVYVIADNQVQLTHTLDQVTTPLHLYVYGQGSGGTDQIRINAGDDLANTPFTYDVASILTAASVDTTELTLGWQKITRLSLEDEVQTTVSIGQTFTLNASAVDADLNDISTSIAWVNQSNNETVTGNSYTLSFPVAGEYLVRVSIDGATPRYYTINVVETDSDSDGLANVDEATHNTDPNNPDSDNDGLLDGEEVNTYDTNPLNNDTDGDSLIDGWEVQHGLDPKVDDAALDGDSDGLTNLQEQSEGTDPNVADTDDDGLSDSQEVNTYQTDPLDPDTDSDGIEDGEEVNTYATDPVSQDSDQDGIPDKFEIDNSLNPNGNDAIADNDSDEYSNLEEYNFGTDPNSAFSFPGADVTLNPLDKHESVVLDVDNLSAAFNESQHHAVRSNIAIQPGSGFFYAEGRRLTAPHNMGIGVATSLETLSGYGGISQQSLGVNTLGYIYYGSSNLLTDAQVRSSLWNVDNYGLAIDYRGLNPVVHVIAADQLILSQTLDHVTTPLFLFAYGIANGDVQQIQINAGTDTNANPFYYDVNAILTAAQVDTSELTLGWQKLSRLILSDVQSQTVAVGSSVTLNATATDPNDTDVTSTIEWENEETNQTAQGGSYTVTSSVPGTHQIRVSVVGALDRFYTVNFVIVDSDNDGLSDATEANLGTDPQNPDTDGDTLPDNYEVENGLDPLMNDANLDSDNDGHTNLEEFNAETNPNSAASYPIVAVTLNPNDSFSSITLSSENMEASFGESNHRSVRSNVAIEQGSGFYYAEFSRLVEASHFGFGVATQAHDLSTYPGNNDQGVGVNILGYVFYNGSILVNSNADINSAEHYGIAVDYTGANPVVYILASGVLVHSLTMDQVTDPLYLSVYGQGGGSVPQIRLNAGDDFADYPFQLSPVDILNNAGVDTVGFTLGWQKLHRLFLNDPQTQEVTVGGTVTLSASATDPDNTDISNTITWQNLSTNETAVGGSYTFTHASVEPVTIRVSLEGAADLDYIVNFVETDTDGDGLSDSQEASLGTDPNNADSDGDSLSDGDEVGMHSTDPLSADSDGDGIRDDYEIAHGLNPAFNDASLDPDQDTYTNLDEFNANTNPNNGYLYPGANVILNPDDKHASIQLSSENMVASFGESIHRSARSSIAIEPGTGFYYSEFSRLIASHNMGFGVATQSHDLNAYPGIDNQGVGVNVLGYVFYNGATLVSDNAAIGGAEHFGLAVDYTGANPIVYILASGQLVRTITMDQVTEPLFLSVYGLAAGGQPQMRINAGDDLSAFPFQIDPSTILSSASVDTTGMTLGWQKVTRLSLDSAETQDIEIGTTVTLNASATDPDNNDISNSITWENLDTNETVQGASYSLSRATTGEVTIRVSVVGTVSREYTINFVQVDNDGDGLSDSQESDLGTDPNDSDSDDDSLSDGEEVNDYDTDPLNADSDGDGLPDGWEAANGTDPNNDDANSDTDSDGLTNAEEHTAGTNASEADTDNDGLLDGPEINTHNTDPLNTDSDADGLTDGNEIIAHETNPLDADTDSDTMPDAYEVANGLNPSDNDGAGDLDNDTFTNLQEFIANTDPNNRYLYPGANVVFNPDDKHASVQLSSENMVASFGESTHRSVRSTIAIQPGTGFYYSEFSRLIPAHDMGFGVATQSHDLNGYPGSNDQGVGVNVLGYVFYNGGSISGDYSNVSNAEHFGVAVDYTGVNPVVYILASSELIQTITMDQVNEPLYLSVYGRASSSEPQIRLNAGDDQQANPFQIDPVAVLTGAGVDTNGLTLGWQKITRLSLDSALNQEVGLGNSVTLNASATDPDNNDITSTISWENLDTNETQTGASYTFSRSTIGEVRVRVSVTGAVAREYTVNFVEVDTDGDGLPDTQESDLGTDPNSADSDGDGLSDGEEVNTHNTDPLSSDSDSDNLPDAWETNNGTNPLADDAAVDTDFDGLTNAEEYAAGTNASDADSDNDGLSDAEELSEHNTNPLDADSDSDGLTDGSEVNTHNTLPLNNDTDGDLMPDGYEVNNGLNPIYDDAASDRDGDTFSNLEEFNANTDPNNAYLYPGAGVTLNADDKYSSVQLSSGNMVASFGESQHRSARTTIAIEPESGFYYAEFSRLTAPHDMGFGVVTQAHDLGGFPGNSVQGVGVNVLGYVFYNGNIVGRAPDLPETDHYGIAVDYTGANPIVHILASNALIHTITLDQVSVPLYMSVYGTANGNVPQMRINAGDDLDGYPFALDPISILTSASVDATGLIPGWQKVARISLESPQTQEITVGDSVTLVATATDPDNNDITNTIAWHNLNNNETQTGGSYSFSSIAIGQVTIRLSVNGAQDRDYTVEFVELDSDSDGLPDSAEIALGTDPNNEDSDGDGLLDGEEVNTHDTDPLNNDSDGDSLPDDWEINNNTNPNEDDASADSDNDGLTNTEELAQGTDASSADSDNDGLSDGAEVNQHSTDPLNADSDADGLTDGAEINTHSSNPLSSDTDSDSMPDGFEVDNGLNPALDDSASDLDSDTHSNIDEFNANTDPNDANSYPGADVTLNPDDRHASIQLSNQNLAATFTESQHRSVRSTIGIQPGSGFYYSEFSRLIPLHDMGFGVATQTHDLAAYPGFNDQGVGVNVQGYVFYNGSTLVSGDNNISSAEHYGVAVDYTAAHPVVHILASGSLVQSVTMDQVTEPLYLSVYGVAANGDPQMSINAGDDRNNQPFQLDVREILNNETIDTSELSLGWQKLTRLNLVDAPEQDISIGESVTLNATATDPDGQDISVNISWTNQTNNQTTLGSSYTFSWPEVSTHYITANVISADGSSASATYTINFVLPDQDQDGLSDIDEATQGTDPNDPDSDNDGLSDGLEIHEHNTNPLNADTDADGLSDGFEVSNNLDPQTDDAAEDPDADGLTNIQEQTHGTNPQNADTDGDTLNDADEINHHSTNPLNPDSDADGLFDGEELNTHSTDPNQSDTDADTMPDGYEIANSLNPLTDDAAGDRDSDSASNLLEFQVGTDPNNASVYPGAPVALNPDDKHASVILRNDNLAAAFSSSEHRSGRSNVSIEPGSGFYYVEATRLSQPENSGFGFGVGTSIVSTASSMGATDQSVGLNTLGYVFYGGLALIRNDASISTAQTYGFAVDYSGSYPIVHIIVNDLMIRTVAMEQVGDPLYLMVYGTGSGDVQQIQINPGDDLGAFPYQYDAATILANANIDTTDLWLGWQRATRLNLGSAAEQDVDINQALVLTASAINSAGEDISASINWLNEFNNGTATGASYSVQSSVVQTHRIVASLVNEYGQTIEKDYTINFVMPDADDDGLPDVDEATHGTDPNNPDSDNDGVLDGDEVNVHNSDPLNNDSDSDTLLDGYEVANGLNPAVSDADQDLDGDGFSNLAEFNAGSSPRQAQLTPDTETIAPQSGWHYVEFERTTDAGDYGFRLEAGNTTLTLMSNGDILLNDSAIAPFPEAPSRYFYDSAENYHYGVAIDYSGASPTVYLVSEMVRDHQFGYRVLYEVVSDPIDLTGVNGNIAVDVVGTDSASILASSINFGADNDANPFHFPANYVLFIYGVAEAEFMGMGWGSHNTYNGRETVEQFDDVRLALDEKSGDGITLSDDGLSAAYSIDLKMGVRANQGMIGEFRYFETRRLVGSFEDRIGTGIGAGQAVITEHGHIAPLPFYFDVQPSVAINSVSSVWKNLLIVHTMDTTPYQYYGFAVDYTGDRPIVHTLIDGRLIHSVEMDDTFTPVYPLIYANAEPDGGFLNAINFGGTPFQMDARAILSDAGINTDSFVNGWGAPHVDAISINQEDVDNDGLTLEQEQALGTDPDNADSDADGLGDGWENQYGLDPLQADTNTSTDADQDGLTLLEEFTNGTDPNAADTDADGLDDAWEIQYGLDPTQAESDTSVDSDGDGLTLLEEYATGTNPNATDTDGDELGDGWESQYGFNPTQANNDTSIDTDQDGLNLLQEYENGTNPNSADSDGDGVNDGIEVANGSNPNNNTDFPDFVGPDITVNGANSRQVDAADILLTGQVADARSGVQSMSAESSQYPGVDFAIEVTGSSWTTTIPLKEGDNIISLTALDTLSNSSTQNVTVTRVNSGGEVSMTITRPNNNAIFTDTQALIEGVIVSQFIADAPSVTIRNQSSGQEISVNATANSNTDFAFDGVITLQEGANSILVTTQVGNETLSDTINLTYQLEAPTAPTPSFEISSPMPGSYVSDSSILLTGTATSFYGAVSVEINGSNYRGENGFVSFQAPISIDTADLDGDGTPVTVSVTDDLNQTYETTLYYFYDNAQPVITLDRPLSQSAVNNVTQQPYVLSGTVVDSNLATFTVDGQSVTLQPVDESTYRFSVNIGLTANQNRLIPIVATDASQQTESQVYELYLDTNVVASIVAPGNGSRLLNNGEPVDLQVIATFEGVTGNETVEATLIDADSNPIGDPQALTLTSSLAAGMVTVPAVSGEYGIQVVVSNDLDVELAETQTSFSMVDPEVVELAVLKTKPALNDADAQPNQPIEIYFNKELETRTVDNNIGIYEKDTDNLITVQVFETAHGHTYVDQDIPGVSSLFSKGYALEKVNRDYQPVQGNAVLVSEGTVVFYPASDMAYSANIFVNVAVNDTDLSRVSFKTRPLPTFIQGGVLDQVGNPVPGIKVSIPKLGRSTVTDKDGIFAFGFGDAVENNIPSGRYELNVNTNLSSVRYGSATRWINIQGGNMNALNKTTLNRLSPEIPFTYLQSGEVNAINGNMMILNLANTDLRFANGSGSGTIHAQFTPYGQYGYYGPQVFMPHWLYTVEPKGVEVVANRDEKGIPVEFQLPAYQGGYFYAPEGDYVLLIGVDKETKHLTPVGVGKVVNKRFISSKVESLRVLDALGIAAMPGFQAELTEYVSTDMSIDKLTAIIQRGVAEASGEAQ